MSVASGSMKRTPGKSKRTVKPRTGKSKTMPAAAAAQGAPPANTPAIILVEPQLGENIGAAARAMLNCGLSELRLVNPRDGWPNGRALASASGADSVIEGAKLFASTREAVADLAFVFATTARTRDMAKPAVTPREAALSLRAICGEGESCGVLFGPERRGLTNDDVVLADTLIIAPLNPAFRSLNLAHAVLMVGYEWLMAAETAPAAPRSVRRARKGEGGPATKGDLAGLFEHLEHELDRTGFLRVKERRPIMVRNLRNIFQRAGLLEHEVRTLHGIIVSLTGRPWGRRGRK
ncbi:MAG: RNA methyltransferase [Alphaproteobacteria bacterium]